MSVLASPHANPREVAILQQQVGDFNRQRDQVHDGGLARLVQPVLLERDPPFGDAIQHLRQMRVPEAFDDRQQPRSGFGRGERHVNRLHLRLQHSLSQRYLIVRTHPLNQLLLGFGFLGAETGESGLRDAYWHGVPFAGEHHRKIGADASNGMRLPRGSYVYARVACLDRTATGNDAGCAIGLVGIPPNAIANAQNSSQWPDESRGVRMIGNPPGEVSTA